MGRPRAKGYRAGLGMFGTPQQGSEEFLDVPVSNYLMCCQADERSQ